MGSTIADQRPLPKLEGLTGQFYAWAKRHELRFQRCMDCRTWRHTPRELCPECSSGDWEWEKSAGRGTVFSWTTTYRPLHPFFTHTPFAQVVVELDEGPRIMSSIVDFDPEELVIGMPVEVIFEDVTSEISLPMFKPAEP